MGRERMFLPAAVLLLALAGCSLGPKSMKADRPAYNIAIQQSESQQLLMNLVRLKYCEPALFLTVSSISTQFSYSANADIGFEKSWGGSDMLSVGENNSLLGYYEAPTITYMPLQGEEFARRMMREMDLGTFALLASGDWDVGTLFQLMIKRLGPLRNDPETTSTGIGLKSGYDKFVRILEIWRQLQCQQHLAFQIVPGQAVEIPGSAPVSAITADAVLSAEKEGYRFVCGEDGGFHILKQGPRRLVVQASYPTEAQADLVDEALGVRPERTRTADGRFAEQIALAPFSELRSDEIGRGPIPVLPVELRSFLDMLYAVAAGIEVPEADRARGVVEIHRNSVGEPFEMRDLTKGILDVRCAPSVPAGAYIGVRYRGAAFYIDDSDVVSKETFALIQFMFWIYAEEEGTVAPVMTLSVGGKR